MRIKIGEVWTLNIENWQTIPDDRQETIEIIGGIVVQDFGHVEEGDKISCSANVSATDKEKIFDYWHNRKHVTIIDEAGNEHNNMRVVVKGYKYVKMFPNYYTINFEFWRI